MQGWSTFRLSMYAHVVNFYVSKHMREAACLLAHERGMTYSAIARALGIRRCSVQTHVERAREKLAQVEGVQLALLDENLDLGM